MALDHTTVAARRAHRQRQVAEQAVYGSGGREGTGERSTRRTSRLYAARCGQQVGHAAPGDGASVKHLERSAPEFLHPRAWTGRLAAA
jgi:hypothetical protein